MPVNIVNIIFKGKGQSLELRHGLNLQALGAKASTPLQFDCRKSDCGICIVNVRKGAENLSLPTAGEADFLKAMRAEASERLACQCRVLGDVTLEVEF